MEYKTSEEVVLTLRDIAKAVVVSSKSLTKKFGITGPQLILLKELDRENCRTVGQLAKRINLSQATVTSMLDRLESHGFVTRSRSRSDKRIVELELTGKTKEILERNPSFSQSSFDTNFNALQPWEQTMLLASVQRLADLLGVSRTPDTGEPHLLV